MDMNVILVMRSMLIYQAKEILSATKDGKKEVREQEEEGEAGEKERRREANFSDKDKRRQQLVK